MFLWRKKISFFVFLTCCLSIACFLLSINVLAQNDGECEWTNIEQAEKNLSRDDYRALLEKCKVYYEKKSSELEESLQKTASNKKSLANDIAVLRKKIQNLDYKISQTNLMIKDLSSQIKSTESSIDKTESKLKEVQNNLGLVLQLRYEEDRKSTISILLGEKSLSAFFDNLVALEALNIKIQDLLLEVKTLKENLENQKNNLDNEKKSLESVVAMHKLQKEESALKQKQQEKFLKLTEQEYQKYLEEQKQAKEKITKIGNLLFQLLEVPEGGIKFEDAVAMAKTTANSVGIRPAFSLAILWQETRIGKLKGGCFLQDTATGDGIYIKSGNKAPKTMHPTRDVPKFLSLIDSLNKAGFLKTDAFHTPVSCCMISNGQYFGWGGAMGPAQFIPSTWLLYKEAVEQKTGSSPANPWNIRDSFLANALYLKDLGAGAQTYQKELTAAMKYFGCTNSWCEANYGRPVMAAANCIQDYIDNKAMSEDCKELIF